MILRINERVSRLSVERRVVRVVRVYNMNIPSGMTVDLLTEKGSLIVATGPSAPNETGAPSANGQVWISDDTQAKGGYWGAYSSGGGDIELTNKSGASQNAGTVVIWDGDNDKAFTVSSQANDRRVAAVLSEDIANNASGKCAVVGKIATVKVQGNVSRGMWLVHSSTEGRAMAGGYTRPQGAIGLALTAYNGGGAGTVDALISVDTYMAAGYTKSYALGGYDTAVNAATQVLTFATETVAGVAGAALSSNRTAAAGASSSDKGMAFGGGNTNGLNSGLVTTDRVTYATDVTANVSGAALSAARAGGASTAGSAAAYHLGGYNTSAAVTATANKMPWSTETTATQGTADLTSSQAFKGGAQSSSNGYLSGGYTSSVSAIADRLAFATDITSAVASANLSAAREGSTGLCDTVNAYFSGGSTGTISTTTDKMPFSTEITAASGSSALSSARKRAARANGLSGYILGGTTSTTVNFGPGSSVATADKLNFSTDVMAAASGANLVTSKSNSASVTAQ